MEDLALKVKISVLWLSCAVAMSAGMVLGFMEPGVIEEVMAEEMSVGVLLFMSVLWLIPLVMAFLSLTLRDAANRRANIILGIVFAVFHFANFIRVTMTGELVAGGILTGLSMIVAPALVAWHAWKWPTQEA